MVHQLFPDGIKLEESDFIGNINQTKELISQSKTIFEAGIMSGDFYVRCDILKPSVDNTWDLIEIKSSSEVKDVHFPDLAFQKFVCEKAGLKINKFFVYFLNKEFVKNGEINPVDIVSFQDVTENVNLVEDVEKNAKKSLEVLKLDSFDDIPISQKCNKPYECPLKKECWATLPEYNVLQLTNWRVYWKLLEEGITDIKDIPAGTKLSAKDEIILESLDKSPYVSKEHIKHFLSSLNYPLYHFDFETIDTAIPMYDKTKPYQKIPFQYSLHIEQEDGTTEHREFLADGDEDPRIKLLEQMKTDLEGTGDIITYNKSFEIGRMNEMAENFPDHKDWLEQAITRIVDLADVFRPFYFYDKSQKGSYSIKKVLPAVTGKSYSELEINNGGDASMLYFYSHIKNELENKEEIRKNLYKYCGLDTEGMVWILARLKELIRESPKTLN